MDIHIRYIRISSTTRKCLFFLFKYPLAFKLYTYRGQVYPTYSFVFPFSGHWLRVKWDDRRWARKNNRYERLNMCTYV